MKHFWKRRRAEIKNNRNSIRGYRWLYVNAKYNNAPYETLRILKSNIAYRKSVIKKARKKSYYIDYENCTMEEINTLML